MKNILVFLLIVCTSCVRVESSTNHVLCDEDVVTTLDEENIFRRAHIIPLETKDSSLIARVNKVVVHDSTIFVLDITLSSLYAFSMSGEFLYTIGETGRGPGEHPLLYDFCINTNNNRVYLLSALGSVYEYAIHGEYIATYRLPAEKDAYWGISTLNDSCFALYHPSNDNLSSILVWDFKNSNELSLLYECDKSLSLKHNAFNNYNDTMYFWSTFDTQVYKLATDGLSNAFSWNLDNSLWNDDILKGFKTTTSNSVVANDRLINCMADGSVPYFFVFNGENDLYRYAQLGSLKNKPINILYNKSSKEYFLFNFCGNDAAYTPLYMDENYLLSELPTKEIEKIKQNASSWIRKNADNISVLDTLSSDANPTLILFEMH